MGNSCSCFNPSQSKTAKLIDLRRNILRRVDVPVTAAELMLEDPGHVISPVSDLRLSAVKADECLIGGTIYVLIPVCRVNGKLSESEMAVIESICGKRRAKRRSSRVIPVVQEISSDDEIRSLGKVSANIGLVNKYRMRPWKPTLEPIYEL
ncbi:hypothetical protein PHJA_002301100 [Phtheirospermum japonicum]|uniref:Uncharacterized protein n=1 Tax=Phtheirospermum japonicum TaxID=374723 RepID=A0A830D597_9LAMI|nr:hypothetical protein PHJA_002301100 [Phtheirospermum japonicum]